MGDEGADECEGAGVGDVDGALEEGEEGGEGGGGEEGDGDDGDAGAEGRVEKVARDEDEGPVRPRGVRAVGEDGELQLWGEVAEGKGGVFGLDELLRGCSRLRLAFLHHCERLPGGGGFRARWTSCCVDEYAGKDENADGGPAVATVDLPEMHWGGGGGRGVGWDMTHP